MATEIIIKEKVFGATRQLLRIYVGVCQEKKNPHGNITSGFLDSSSCCTLTTKNLNYEYELMHSRDLW